MGIRERDLQNICDALTADEKEKLSGGTVLITGCAGFLGYYFMSFFAEHGKSWACTR